MVISKEMLANNNKRFLNYLIDLIPQYVFGFGLGAGSVYFGEYTGYYELSQFLGGMSVFEDVIFSYSILLLYYITFESLTFRSLGKYVTKTKVVMHNGEEPTARDIIIRNLCRLIPFDGFSFLGKKGKGWHDSISKTYVVDIEKFEAGRFMALELDQIGRMSE